MFYRYYYFHYQINVASFFASTTRGLNVYKEPLWLSPFFPKARTSDQIKGENVFRLKELWFECHIHGVRKLLERRQTRFAFQLMATYRKTAYQYWIKVNNSLIDLSGSLSCIPTLESYAKFPGFIVSGVDMTVWPGQKLENVFYVLLLLEIFTKLRLVRNESKRRDIGIERLFSATLSKKENLSDFKEQYAAFTKTRTATSSLVVNKLLTRSLGISICVLVMFSYVWHKVTGETTPWKNSD